MYPSLLGISFQGYVHVVFYANIIYNQPFVFSGINAVYAGNGLYQRVLLQWFVNVHGVQTRHIETCYPHVHDYGDFEIGFRFFEFLCMDAPVIIRTQ